MSRRSSLVAGSFAVACLLAGVLLYVRQLHTANPSAGPGADRPAVALDAALPFDAAISAGTLDNGLRYIVRANRQPQNRAELRLVVNAGSLVEDDDQLGLAHVVEHMAFNGTRRFPGQAVGRFLESIGMRFGPSINATTGYDETVYALQIPTDRDTVIDQALTVLEEWAHAVTFDPVEVDKERGVIVEEWRLRRGAGQRLQDQQLPMLLAGSRHADRPPIGTPESIRTFVHRRLRDFYRDWYRPDLMAVIAVGDFDAAAMTQRIRARFGALPPAASPRPRPEFAVPEGQGTTFVTAADPEASQTAVSVMHRRPAAGGATVGDYRRDLVERLALGMLSARLAEIAQTPKGPFVAAGASRRRLVRAADVISLSAVVSDAGVLPALTTLANERERVRRFGFTEQELARQKDVLARGLERAMTEADRLPSAALAAEYVRHVTIAEPVPGLAWEYDTTTRLLPSVSVDDVSEAARQALADRDVIVSVAAPRKASIYMPAERELAAAMASAASASLRPWVPRPTASALMDELPVPGRIVATTEHPGVQAIEWRLENGARVIVKSTDFKGDQIAVRAVSRGGLSLAEDEDLVPAQTAVQAIGSMGFGRFASGDLQRFLAGKGVSAQPAVGPFESSLSGVGTRAELETLFQLIHLIMTAPRRDPGIFAAMQRQMRTAIENQMATPEFAFASTLTAALSQDHPRARPLTVESLDRMNLDASLAFYRARFGNASGFTFVVAGSVEATTLRPLVERYLASLPGSGSGETWRDPGMRPPDGIVERTVRRGIEPKGRTAIVFAGPMTVDRPVTVAMGVMADILQTRLRNAIREDLGGTYQITAGASTSALPVGQYTVSVDFSSDPARLEGLVTRVFEEIRRYRREGPTLREVQDVQAAALRDFETNSRQNGFVAQQMAQYALAGEPLGTLWELPALVKQVTPMRVRDVAQRTLDPGRYVRVTLLPD